MSDSSIDTSSDSSFESDVAETARIIRTGTIWTGATVVAAAVMLGPMLAAGWRPSDLPGLEAVVWWLGATATTIGIALLVWAGCPVPSFTLTEAHRQKVFSIRVGIAMTLGGMVVATVAVLLSPA